MHKQMEIAEIVGGAIHSQHVPRLKQTAQDAVSKDIGNVDAVPLAGATDIDGGVLLVIGCHKQGPIATEN